MYISKRGVRLTETPQPLVRAHFKCAEDPWHETSNPQGYINLGTAENHLLYDLIGPRLNQGGFIGEHHTHYGPLHGLEEFRQALARFLGNTTGVNMTASEIAAGSGASAMLDMMMYAMCEPGDGVLIPAPYYAGFDHDLKTRVQVEPIPAMTKPQEGFKLTRKVLQEALLMAGRRQIKVRALLLANPNNPLGITYDEETLRMLVGFAREHGLELISDELYARSVFGKETPFTSLIKVAEEAGLNAHLVYGFAKDFGLSGFKTGVLYTKNAKLMEAVQQLAYFMPVSNATQALLTTLLDDEEFIERFGRENQQRLAHASACLDTALSEHNISAHPRNAGFFAWLDLSPYLSQQDEDAEMQLYEHLLEKARVNITPGQFFHSPKPGWFRLCYGRPDELIRLSVKRLAAALQTAPPKSAPPAPAAGPSGTIPRRVSASRRL
ncbi:MAG: aminotransferase class I/II-fold pyridoxal phosphate-dependent enzyme [Cyclonatronaceae bacterium]